MITVDCDVFGCWEIGEKEKGNENVEVLVKFLKMEEFYFGFESIRLST